MKRITFGALMACLSLSSVALAQTAPEDQPPMTQQPAPQTEPTPPPPTEPVPPNTTIINNPAPLQPAPVVVETTPPPQPIIVREQKRDFFDRHQVGLELGGGFADFAHAPAENATNAGGTWDVRLVLGARSPLGVEIGYVGTANDLHGAGGITANAAEAALRLGTPGWYRIPVQIYGFGGAGINRFDWVNSEGGGSAGSLTFSKVDTTMVVPFGGGLQFNLDPHLSLDARFTYRAMFDDDLVRDGVGRDQSLDQYTATAKVGYMF